MSALYRELLEGELQLARGALAEGGTHRHLWLRGLLAGRPLPSTPLNCKDLSTGCRGTLTTAAVRPPRWPLRSKGSSGFGFDPTAEPFYKLPLGGAAPPPPPQPPPPPVSQHSS